MPTINMRVIVAYLAGLLSLVNLLGALTVPSAAAILHAIAAVIALPPTRRYLAREYDLRLTTGAVITVWVCLTVAGNVWLLL